MAQKKFCTNCGNSLKSDDMFCGRCGQPVDEESKKSANYSNINNGKKKSCTEKNNAEKKDINYKNNNAGRGQKPYSRVEADRFKFPKKVGHFIFGILSFLIIFFAMGSAYIMADNYALRYSSYFIWLLSRYFFFYLWFGLALFITSFYSIKLNLQIFYKDRMAFFDLFVKKYAFFSNLKKYAKVFSIIFAVNAFLYTVFISIYHFISVEFIAFIFTAAIFLTALYLNSRFLFALFITLEKGQNYMESLKGSFELSAGSLADIAGPVFFIFVINFFASKSYFTGYIITLPLSIYILTKIYHDLKK